MEPKLKVLRGRLKGESFPVVDEILVGRDTASSVAIPERYVSRQHCVIKRDQDRCTIRDLDSLHGTFVNGSPVKERALEHGDQIQVANTVLVFLLREDEAADQLISTSDTIQWDEPELPSNSTISLSSEDSRYLRKEFAAEREETPRVAKDLEALLKIATDINSIRGSQTLHDRLLEMILGAVPAEQGSLIPAEQGEADYGSICAKDQAGVGDSRVHLSRTVVNGVLRDSNAILINNVQSSDLKNSESLIATGSTSILCVPLVLHGRMLGVVYLTTSDPASSFDEDHLHLLVAIAAIAASSMENNRYLEWLESENQLLKEDLEIEHNMIGESEPIRGVYTAITRVSPTDSTILIRGENGTGKELVARAVHNNSGRAQKPFVAVNCAALTETLLESELFGHERGAFTGAYTQKKGKLELANHGTLFLDEIGELAPSLQAKLLRVLQEREFERVGGTRPLKVDIRLVAATNKDLEKAIEDGTFRADLYYRINVVAIEVPPLRQRSDDIVLLAQHFAARSAKQCNRVVTGISRQARQCLLTYSWPGNVRELQNAVERAVVLGSSEVIRPEDLPEAVIETEGSDSEVAQYHEALNEKKKQLILGALKNARGSFTQGAKQLGLHPNYLHRLIRNLNLREEIKKES